MVHNHLGLINGDKVHNVSCRPLKLLVVGLDPKWLQCTTCANCLALPPHHLLRFCSLDWLDQWSVLIVALILYWFQGHDYTVIWASWAAQNAVRLRMVVVAIHIVRSCFCVSLGESTTQSYSITCARFRGWELAKVGVNIYKLIQIVNLKTKIGVAREARIEMVWLGMTNPQRLQLIGNLMAHCNRHGLLATAKLRSLPFQHVQLLKEHPSIDIDCYAQYTRCVTVSKSEVTSK